MNRIPRIFSLTLLMLFLSMGLHAQNGNAVVSEVTVYDNEDGSGSVEVRISGNLSTDINGAMISLSGARIPGGSYVSVASSNTRPCSACGGVEVILVMDFPLGPGVGPQDDFVDVSIQGAIIITRRSRAVKRPSKYY